MKPWWQVATPHRDIREGRIGDFAADLYSIMEGKASVEYMDPEIFFRRTHLTKGLENVVKDVILVLSGKTEKGRVIHIQTPMGGGKTHTLVYLYHLFKSGRKFSHYPEIKRILGTTGLESMPDVNMAVFVGTAPNVLSGRTPWGEIAYQLGEYELMRENDRNRTSPGRELIERILEKRKPVLILVDELAEYIVKAKEFEDQVFAFSQELTEAVSKSLDKCVLVCTLPSSTPYGERGEKVLSQLQRIFGRMQVIYTPVEGEEIYEIIRKRLFEDLGDIRDHEIAAAGYFDLYQRLGDEVPSKARDANYRERIKKAYPFHPELIDILFERWTTIPGFQRTRGVLRLLAEVVADLFGRDPLPLILPSSVNLANQRIRRMLIEHIGEVFEGVLASDIIGDSARAPSIDKRMGSEYAKFRVATRLATSIFLYSFSGGERKGATVKDLRIAVLSEGIPPPIIGDALKKLEDLDGPLYLHSEKGLYYFSSKVGLNRIIIDKEDTVKDEEIEEEIKKRLEKVVGRDFEVFIWPTSNRDIPDDKKLKLVVLPLEMTRGDPRTRRFVEDVLTYYSSSFRIYKNTILFLAPDLQEYNGVRSAVRRFLALKAINSDNELLKTLTDADKEKAREKMEDMDSNATFNIISMYRHLIKIKGFRDGNLELLELDLGIPTRGKISITARVKSFLKDQDILLEKIDPKIIARHVLKDEEKKIADIWDAFLRFPDLPMLENENVLKSSIAKGVKDGLFGLLVRDKVFYGEEVSVQLEDDVFVIGKEKALEMKAKEAEKIPEEAPSIAPKKEVIETVGERRVKPEKVEIPVQRIHKLMIRAEVPWSRLSDVIRGILNPLHREGSEISLEIKIDAKSEQGISRDTLDRKIKETLKQIDAKIKEEKLE